jgi:hypothetical protein
MTDAQVSLVHNVACQFFSPYSHYFFVTGSASVEVKPVGDTVIEVSPSLVLFSRCK